MKNYDFVFGLGRACACTQSLRSAGLQLLSLPWDWITYQLTPQGPDLLLRVDLIASGFAGWFEEEDLKFVRKNPESGKDLYINKRTKIIYPHDFTPDIPLHEAYPAIKAKYDRRVKRFLQLLSEAKSSILAVYMDTPTHPAADVETCREAQRRLQTLYPRVKVDFLMFSLEQGRPFEKRIVEDLGDGFTRVAFDYRNCTPGLPKYSVHHNLCAAAMREIASVREYRTAAEIKNMNAHTRRVKMQEVGASNAWEYFLARRRMELSRIMNILYPREFFAKLRQKKFDHVFSLGMNCEPAFRFSLSWGFVDSTPFSWGLFGNLRLLADALRHPEYIGSEGYSWYKPHLMWRCEKTMGQFHGRLNMKACNSNPDPKALDEDRQDLVQRIKYLNDKFTRVLADDSSKALILRVHTRTALASDANDQIDAVQSAIEARGARNYTLVVVTERAARGRIASAPNRVLRTVRAFNPGADVANPKLGDSVGWRALFAEFTPAKILPKKHAFKFEKD